MSESKLFLASKCESGKNERFCINSFELCDLFGKKTLVYNYFVYFCCKIQVVLNDGLAIELEVGSVCLRCLFVRRF